MKKIIISFLSLSLISILVISCEKDPILEPVSTITFEDLTITSITIPDIPANGGTVEPIVTYSFTEVTHRGKTEEKVERTTGATVSFESMDYRLKVYNNILSVNINETIEDILYPIVATVRIGQTKAQMDATAKQLANNEEIISSETLQLPLRLGPHTCVEYFTLFEEISYTSENENGIVTFADHSISSDRGNIGDPECISVFGNELDVTGGHIARIDTYRSGRIDTTILTEAVFEAVTTYEVLDATEKIYTAGKDSPEYHIDHPSSSYSNNKWSISKVGIGSYHPVYYKEHDVINEYFRIKHTLKATADGKTVSLTLWQHENREVSSTHRLVDIQFLRIGFQRDYYNWPNIEDYPAGSNPKWPRVKDVYTMFDWSLPEDKIDDDRDYYNRNRGVLRDANAYANFYDTKDMHPDGNRDLSFMVYGKAIVQFPQRTYMTGDKSPLHYDSAYAEFWKKQVKEVKITATAEVKMKNGRKEKVEYVYECKRSPDFDMYDCFNAYLPVVKYAAEDFCWNIKFEYEFFSSDDNKFCGLKPDEIEEFSNYNDFDWSPVEFKVMDRLSLISDWQNQTGMWFCENGFYL